MTTDLKPYESIVLVRWADAESDSDWRDKDEIQGKVIDDPGYSTHLTVGIFVHQDEGKIIVVQNISQDSFSCFMKIPMGCVQSVEQIGQVKFEATPPVGGIEVKSKSQEKRIAIQKGQGGGRKEKEVASMGHACCGAKYTKHLKDCPNREGGAAKKLKYVCIDCDHTMKVTEPPAACEKCGKPNIVQK